MEDNVIYPHGWADKDEGRDPDKRPDVTTLRRKEADVIRFAGEPVKDTDCNKPVTRGSVYLRLLESDVKLHGNGENPDLALISFCVGTSLSKRPRLQLDETHDARRRFAEVADRLVAELVETIEIASYFETMRSRDIVIEDAWSLAAERRLRAKHARRQAYADARQSGSTTMLLAEWAERNPLPEEPDLDADLRLSPAEPDRYRPFRDGDGDATRFRTALALGDGIELHRAFPLARLARVYFPHDVLVVDAVTIPWDEVLKFRAAVPSKDDLAAFRKRLGGFASDDLGYLIGQWRRFMEEARQHEALAAAGFAHLADPERWLGLDRDGVAVDGCSYRRCWGAINVDLALVAIGSPDNVVLTIGSNFGRLGDEAGPFVDPRDDDPERTAAGIGPWKLCAPSVDYNYDGVCWFPAGDGRSAHPCRGWKSQEHCESPYHEAEKEWLDDWAERLGGYYLGHRTVTSDEAWGLLDQEYLPFGTAAVADSPSSPLPRKGMERRPVVRLAIDAPEGPADTLADRTLAADIVRSLTYGAGPDALANRLRAAVERRVRLLEEMRAGERAEFAAARARNGSRPKPSR